MEKSTHYKLEHPTQFPEIVGITNERIRDIIWEMLSKKVINILEQFQWLNTTYYCVLLDSSWLGTETDNEKFKIQAGKYTPQNFAEIYLRRVNYPSFWPFLDYHTPVL